MFMKINKIALCLTVALSSVAYAAESPAVSDNGGDFVDSVLSNSLFSDAKLDLSLRNYWKYLKEDAANPKEVHNAWGQGVSLDYKSGYFADFIGFDATYYGAIKLGASDYFNTRGVLYNNGSGNNKHNADGYSKVGQRYVKLKYSLADVNFDARGGWQMLRNYGVISTSTRLSPTTYLGWSGGINYDGFTVRGAYVTSSMDRNSPDKKSLQTNDGKDIDHLVTGDIGYKNDIVSAQYAYGESDNYLRRNILLLNLKPVSHLNIGTQIYGTKALDDYKSMAASRRDFDDDAWHYAIDAKWQEQNWSTKLGLAYTKADKENAVGFYPRHMSKNSRGTFTSMTFAGEDYMRDGEKVLSLLTDYKLSPQFTAGLTGNYGQFSYKGNNVKTGEINLFGRWTPNHPKLKNLSVAGMFGPGWSYKNVKRTPVLTNGDYSHSHFLAAEIIVDYRFNVF
jgi:hypothetical protein